MGEICGIPPSYYVNIEKVTNFVLQIVYNFPKKKKSSGDKQYVMLYVGKFEKKSFNIQIISSRSSHRDKVLI